MIDEQSPDKTQQRHPASPRSGPAPGKAADSLAETGSSGRLAWRAPSIHESECGLEINCYAAAGGLRARP